MPAPSWISVGQSFYIGNYTLSGGADYLFGPHTIASIAGNVITYNSGVTGATGIQVGKGPAIALYQPGSTTAVQACYGHN